MDAQELKDREKVSIIIVKNLNKIVNKMSSTVSSMIGMKPKDEIKLDKNISKRNHTTREWII